MRYLAFMSLAAALFLSACSDKKAEPKAEASVTVDTGNAKDKINNALDKAGNEMKKAGNETKAKLEDAGDAIKKKTEEAKDKLSGEKKAEVNVEAKTK
jgi:hypothetical protein